MYRLAAKKSTGNSRAKAQKSSGGRGKDAALERQQHETAGVILIAVGVLLGAYMFFSATGFLGKVILLVLFGLFGIMAYALPLVFIGLGVLSIKGGRSASLRGTAWLVVLGVLALITLLHVTQNADYADTPYMQFLSDAYDLGLNSRHGGGFVGAALCYPLQKLGGSILAYTLLITIIILSIATVTGLSIRDMSAKVGESVQTVVQNAQAAYEERTDPERKLFTFDLDGDDKLLPPAEKPAKKSRAANGKPSAAGGKKVSKKKQAKMLSDVDELVSFLPMEGALSTKDGKTPRPARPQLVVSDIWENIEPVVDVPPVIESIQPAPAPAPQPLPDISPLFGAQAAPVPAEVPDKKKKKPVEKDVKPAGAAAAKPIHVGKSSSGNKTSKTTPDDSVIDIPYTNAPAYERPPFTLLHAANTNYAKAKEAPQEKANLLIATLATFNISAKLLDISVGPTLTRFELQPAPGVRVNRITSLSNDIALALAAQRVRIEAPIPGKSAVGIEIPNKDTVAVVLRDIVESKEFQESKSPITMALGKDISGRIVVADLDRMPHMLIAGATGSGKSVCINDIIVSMIYKSSPAELKLILIDPKIVELTAFGALPHLLTPVVTDVKKAASALRWAVNEMMRRYKLFADVGAKDFYSYNKRVAEPESKLPKLVVIIDELADLMMVASREVEDYISRIAQLGRAAGVHLIVATQRPSADIITGIIRSNIPSRCAFAVSSGVDSRIILDSTGAEKLLGRGDMLFHPAGSNKPMRMQCAFVSGEDVDNVIEFFEKRKLAPAFDEGVLTAAPEDDEAAEGGATGGDFGEGKQTDELLGKAVRVCLETGVASTSLLQRRLRVGYTRGSRLIDIMESKGYISPFEGSKPRKLLITREEYAEIFDDHIPFEDKEAKLS